MRKKQESLEQLVARVVPCIVKYWSSEAHRLERAARQGLCDMEVLPMPNWKFTKRREV
jgi:hypothetical protein